jgi:uncharacterized protein (TIGR02145 family)
VLFHSKYFKELKLLKTFNYKFKNKQEMKKNLILMMLLLAGAVSMNAQGAPENPTMVVTGNVVNTGKITSKIAIDLRTSPSGVSTIDNQASGDIKTPYFYVDANTLLNNEGEIYVGSVSGGSTAGSVEIDGVTYTTGNFGVAGTWMTENLRRTAGLTENPGGTFVGTPAYTHVNLDDENDAAYGLLYNWYGATNGENLETTDQGNTYGQAQIQGICPDEWHLPSDYELSLLETAIAVDYTGLYSTLNVADNSDYFNSTLWRGTNAGQKMRSTTNVDGVIPTVAAYSLPRTSGGFDALLSGHVNGGACNDYGRNVAFWSSSNGNIPNGAYSTSLGWDVPTAYREGAAHKANYFSVRCKKN